MRVEEAVAECMRHRGWDYVAAPPQVDGFEGFYASWDESVAATWGYGHATTVLPERFFEFQDEFGSRFEAVDPNREYVDGLDEEERAAYERDLRGFDVAAAGEESGEEGRGGPEPPGDRRPLPRLRVELSSAGPGRGVG
ncbi:MAG TPA: hypothetical protein ENK55_00425 [Actinobacteria bacterium]|nr:hypothetical protein [Actinomycetota bacterium]